MTSRTSRILAVAAVLGVAAVPVAFAQEADAPAKATRAGIGDVKIGATYKSLRADKLVGKIRRGCELGGPSTREANLITPLRGSVTFSEDAKRKVTGITATKGAESGGVGIGDPLADVQQRYPSAKVDRTTEEVFSVALVKVPNSRGKVVFAVDARTDKVTSISVPGPSFCE